jgi:IS30 family transposase
MLETEIKIRTAMWRKNLSAAEIGRRIGVHRVTVHQVIRGRMSRRVRRGICEYTGLPYSIWTEMDRELKVERRFAA